MRFVEKGNISLEGIRIAVVVHTLSMGGCERQAVALAKYLIENEGCSVEIVGYDFLGNLTEICDRNAIPWRFASLIWSDGVYVRFKCLLKLAYFLRATSPDIILPYSIVPNVSCALSWKATGAQICLWNQAGAAGSVRGKWTKFELFAVRQASGVISNSQHGASLLVKHGIDPKRITVIPNGVQLENPQFDVADWHSRLDTSTECSFLACMIANLSLDKDHITLLKAWRIVIDRLSPIKQPILILAGAFADNYKVLSKLAEDLGILHAVRFLGHVDDVSGLLRSVHLGVFSSHTEGVPNGVLESMAAGLAIAGTDIPGIREAIGSDNDAYLSPRGDAELLAENIARLALNEQLRRNVGELNRRRIETYFSLRQMCQRTASLLKDKRSQETHCY